MKSEAHGSLGPFSEVKAVSMIPLFSSITRERLPVDNYK